MECPACKHVFSIPLDGQYEQAALPLLIGSKKEDSRPAKLVNTCTVDNESRFVFKSTINFGYSSDWESIKADNVMPRDHEKPEWKQNMHNMCLATKIFRQMMLMMTYLFKLQTRGRQLFSDG